MSIRDRVRSLTNVFGEWQIKEELGGGSNGKTSVFRIIRPHGKFVEEAALKVVNIIEENGNLSAMSAAYQAEYNQRKQELEQKAIEEVRVMYRLQGNSTIVGYQDYSTHSFQDARSYGCDLFIRMELMEQDLHSLQKQGTVFAEAEILQIAQAICTALELCHGVNIWHRDIKPANIFRSRQGQYKLGDFGISRIVSAGQSAGTNVGTKPYAAPEQFFPEYDNRVDIYSLGLTLYELANRNRLPFSETTFVSEEAIRRRLRGEPLPLPAGVSPNLGAVLLKACAFDAASRFQSASEFRAALQAASGSGNASDLYGTQMAMPREEETPPVQPPPTSERLETQEIHIHNGMSPAVVVTLVICIVLIVIVAMGAAAYLFFNSQNAESEGSGESSAETTTLQANADDSTDAETLNDRGDTDPSLWGTEDGYENYPEPTRTLIYVADDPMTGGDVKHVQAALKELSYDKVEINGIYDSDTEAAVERFQKKHGPSTSESGEVDSATLEKLHEVVEYYREEDEETARVDALAASAEVTSGTLDDYSRPLRTLKFGMTGDDVRYVQAALTELSYDKVKINGVYDSNTQAAVKRYQKNHKDDGLSQTGEVDSSTLSSMENLVQYYREQDAAKAASASSQSGSTSSSSSDSSSQQSAASSDTSQSSTDTVNADDYPVPERTLSYNADDPMTGDDVKYVQAALIEMNYTDTPITVNGIYDSDTVAAVKRFQENHNCTVDGIVGDETLTELQAALAAWRETH